MSAGWLPKDDTLSPDFGHGVYLGRVSGDWQQFPTRREEYWLLANTFADLPRGVVLDFGCGYNPDVHVAPEILAHMGFNVIGVDEHTMDEMPSHKHIARIQGDMTMLVVEPPARYAICISVLEHLEDEQRAQALRTIRRSLRDGGAFLVTADEVEPETLKASLEAAGFTVGDVVPNGAPLTRPRVAWALATARSGG